MHVKRRDEQENPDRNEDRSFSQVLEKTTEKNRKTKEVRKEDTLRLMGGLNQYNRHAVEFCFRLSSETDFRA